MEIEKKKLYDHLHIKRIFDKVELIHEKITFTYNNRREHLYSD